MNVIKFIVITFKINFAFIINFRKLNNFSFNK